MSYMCAECKHLGCKKGDLTKTMTCCPSKNEEVQAEAARLYQEPENYNIAHTAAKLEAQGYGRLCRMEEIMRFAKNAGFHKIGLVFCFGLQKEAQEVSRILADTIGADFDYVAAYMMNDHMKVHVDPLSNSIVRAWGILDQTGFLDANAKNINIEDHINTSIYEQALAECEAEFGAENPEFYAAMNDYYAANNG